MKECGGATKTAPTASDLECEFQNLSLMIPEILHN